VLTNEHQEGDDPSVAVRAATDAGDGVPPLLLRPRDAARVVAVGESTIYELMDRGAFPSVRIGRSRRIRVRDLEAWVDSLT